MKILGAALCAGLFAAACAASVPAEKVSAVDSSIRAAEVLGAHDVPQAALHLQMAKDATKRAQELIAEEEPESAIGMLMRAQADAELAMAETREVPVQSQAKEAMARARDLQRQIDR